MRDIDRLTLECKTELSQSKMADLQEKVQIAIENVEESDSLTNKLEKEIIEWNAQKKLTRRDAELEEIQNMCAEFLEDLLQEKQNTEVELDKNREKQLENKDQELVDKDGNAVDIVKDLIKLEKQMGDYINEIDGLVQEITNVENNHAKCFGELDSELPKVVKDQRKIRAAQAREAGKVNPNLKRPAQFLKPNVAKKTINLASEDDEKASVHTLISINCRFKQRIQTLLRDLKAINKKRQILEENYSEMRREVFKIK